MKTIISIIFLVASLGWGPATDIINLGQGNVALANASAINQAAQMASVMDRPFSVEAQDLESVLAQLNQLGYLSELDRQKIERSAGRLRPVSAFKNWRDVEFIVSGG